MRSRDQMRPILGGELEFALMRRIYEEYCPEKMVEDTWAVQLLRRQHERMYSRVSTILAISEVTRYAISGGDVVHNHPRSDEIKSLLGLEEYWRPGIHMNMMNCAWDCMGSILQNRSITDRATNTLASDNKAYGVRRILADELSHIVFQVWLASERGGCLFLPDADYEFYSEFAAICPEEGNYRRFVPDLSKIRRSPDDSTVGLLCFEPPDLASIATVRKDAVVRRYAEAVHDLWSIADPVERERTAISAMRAVVAADDARAQVSYVFEASAWWLKPLSWASVPGASIVADVRDGVATLFDRRRRKNDWLLIRPRMQDISLRDYLRRKANY